MNLVKLEITAHMHCMNDRALLAPSYMFCSTTQNIVNVAMMTKNVFCIIIFLYYVTIDRILFLNQLQLLTRHNGIDRGSAAGKLCSDACVAWPLNPLLCRG